MKTPWLRSLGPNTQVFAFTLVFFLCTLITGALLQALLKILFQLDFNDSEIFSDFSQPGTLSAHRLMSIFNSIGVFLLPALITYRLVSFPVEDFLKMKSNPKWFFLLILLLLGLSVQAPVNFIYYLNQQISFPESLAGIESTILAMEEERAIIIDGLFSQGSGEALFINLFILALLPALAEEFFFRGVLQQLFQKAFHNKHHWAIWITAFVFSFIHFQFLGFFPRMLLGALLGYVFYYSNNIWYVVFLHFINNAIGILLHYLVVNKCVNESVEMFGAQEKIPLIISVMLTAGLLIYFRKKILEKNKA